MAWPSSGSAQGIGTVDPEPGPQLVQWYAGAYDVDSQEATERLRLQLRGRALVPRLQTELGESYAGVYFDNSKGRFVIPLVEQEDDAAALTAAKKLGISPDEVSTKVVSHSMRELEKTRVELLGQPSVAKLLGDAKLRIEVRARTNSVNVVVAEGASASRGRTAMAPEVEQVAQDVAAQDAATLSRASDSTFGATPDAGCVWEQFNSRCDRPLRGGVSLFYAGSSICSMGALARRGVSYFVMTAGHCLVGRPGTWKARHRSNDNLEVIGTQGGHNYGTTYASASGRTGDSGAINVDPGQFWAQVSVWPGLTFADNYQDEYPNTGIGWSYEGLGVCHLGQRTPNNVGAGNCGAVTATAVNVPYVASGHLAATTVNVMTQVSYCSAGGDSGGTVTAGNILFGIHSGSAGCVGYYEDAPIVQDDHGVTFVTQ
ncbi:S1 family peptidase [Patulibacter sp. S7RM1-6]